MGVGLGVPEPLGLSALFHFGVGVDAELGDASGDEELVDGGAVGDDAAVLASDLGLRVGLLVLGEGLFELGDELLVEALPGDAAAALGEGRAAEPGASLTATEIDG